jgi:hypothetical protein
MSFAVMSRAMARASWATRWMMRRSVLRRSCPKFESHELVRSTVWGAQTRSCWRPAVLYRVTERYRGQSEAGKRLGWLRRPCRESHVK